MDKKPLYRFKLDEEKGQISKLEINDYSEVVWYSKREYRYRLMGSIRDVKSKNLDRFVHDQVHTFNPDFEHARQIMLDDIGTKQCKAHEDYLKYTEIKNKLNGWGT